MSLKPAVVTAIGPSTPVPRGWASGAEVWRHFLASAILYSGVVCLYGLVPFFREMLQIRLHGVPALHIYWWAYGIYLALSLPIYLLWRPDSLRTSKNVLVLCLLARSITGFLSRATSGWTRQWTISDQEKSAVAFFLIKLFYAPLMVNSALLEYNGFPGLFTQWQLDRSWLNRWDVAYLWIVSGVFFFDSVCFVIGYHTESGLLRNKLRYAETNVFRILICVSCYAPFNMATSAFFGSSNQDIYIRWAGQLNHPLTWVLRGAAACSLLLMIWATLSLFTKASNLTNRGIVRHGPYRYIRHPGYLAKNLFWIMTVIPLFVPNTAHPQYSVGNHAMLCLTTIWGILGWATIYFLRAVTEEQFLGRDPDYVDYCRKVRYRFIPGVY